MDHYPSYYTSHKNGDYTSGHANHHMHGASSEFRLPPEPGIANSGFAGKSSHAQTARQYGTNQFHDPNVDPGLEDIRNEPRGLSILRNATHQMLMDSGNVEYARIYAERHEFLGKIHKLETRIEVLEEYQEKREKQFMDTITNMGSKHSAPGKMSFAGRREEALRTAFPLAYKSEVKLSSIVDPIEDDSGLLNFWATGSFKPGREYPGTIAKRLRFLEDENGVPMTQKRLDVIRKFLSGAFKELKELMYELLPKKGWATGADRELMARCHLELAQRFPELSYCQDGWKSRSLMVEWFPSFQRNHMPDAEIHNTVKLEDAEEGEDDEARATSVPAKRVAESSRAPRKKMKKEPELRIPELEDPLAQTQKPSTGCVNKESASKTIPELQVQVVDPLASNNQQVTATPTSTTSTTFSKPPNKLPQNAEPTSTPNTSPMLKPTSTASTATLTNDTLDTGISTTPKTIETNAINGNSQPDMAKGAPTMDMPSSVASNVSTMGPSSPSVSMFVTSDKQPRPRPLKLFLKLPANLPKDDAASSSPASDAPADGEPRPGPRSLQDVNKVNPITMAGASVSEAPANTSSGTGKGKTKAAARKGKKPVKDYVVNPNSTTPKDLFANDYLADPENAEKTKAVDVLRAWKVLSEEERQGYSELSKELKRERKGEN